MINITIQAFTVKLYLDLSVMIAYQHVIAKSELNYC